MAQQSEKIESGSLETARSGQQTVQLRDTTRHLSAEPSTAQSPPKPLCPVKPCRGSGCHSQHGWISAGTTQSSWAAWRHLTGCTQSPTGHNPKQGHASTSIPQGNPPQHQPACSSAGQALLPCTPEPPGLPLIPPLQTFPGLGKPLNQAVAGTMCCSLALAGARGCELHHLLRAESRDEGHAACTASTRDTQPQQGPGDAGASPVWDLPALHLHPHQ